MKINSLSQELNLKEDKALLKYTSPFGNWAVIHA